MTPWFHVRHVALMPATCDCAWLLKMPIVATMRGHRLLASLGRWHHDPLGPCAPGEFRVFESVGCLQLLHLLALLQRFATSFEICGCDCCDSSIEICSARQSIYLVLRGGCWGRANKPRSWLFRTAVLESASALSLPYALYIWHGRPKRLIIPLFLKHCTSSCPGCSSSPS